MAFADPQTVTIDAVAHPMPRTGISTTEGVFTQDDSTYSLKINQPKGNSKRLRRAIRLDFNDITANPFLPAENRKVSGSIILSIDLPDSGFTNADVVKKVQGFLTYLAASSAKPVADVLGGQL
ncbi:TPA_asm: coat protein [ssRNA phage Esthiorhiza.2_29]|uniref:Coat protein n=2 Tax=Leviviricetes TaxID=2842243 RepID=A0A8S5L3X1_9VIRU|nr:coat protein [ssRNA phage Esthiorhiza.2_29]QDH87107.1 MAG: hypothetical protein H2RhizoLitter491611_000002 [Leviviridae sp.]DAD51874.1 TPA_asm: coat protein [ssRNA phage Esthiorhiza.2_29]